jgi:elongation factor P
MSTGRVCARAPKQRGLSTSLSTTTQTVHPMKAADIKKGNVVEYNNGIYQIRDIERSSPQGRGGNVRFRFIMYSVPGGTKLDASFDADDNLPEVELLRRQATFSYMDGEAFVFLDDQDYTPYTLDAEVIGEAAGYISQGLTGSYVQVIDDQPVALQLPQHVTLEVVETPPELKGGTATKRPKPARLSTGIEIMVPEYITTGERILINTTTGEFGGRAD